MVKDTDANIADDYARSGFGKTLGFGKSPVLLIVDFVMAYLDPNSPLYAGVEGELDKVCALVAAARNAHIPVIWTNVEYEPGGANGGHFYRKITALKVFDRGSPLGDFPDQLKPTKQEIVFTKQYPSAFFGTALDHHLRAHRIDSVIITGLTTSGCVRATALDVLQYGYAPIVVEDACGDRDPHVHEANIFDLGAKYADIVQTRDVLNYFKTR